MESSGPSGNTSDPHQHRWAKVFGTFIAVLTLTLPVLAIAYYSSNRSIDPLSPSNYVLPKTGD